MAMKHLLLDIRTLLFVSMLVMLWVPGSRSATVFKGQGGNMERCIEGVDAECDKNLGLTCIPINRPGKMALPVCGCKIEMIRVYDPNGNPFEFKKGSEFFEGRCKIISGFGCKLGSTCEDGTNCQPCWKLEAQATKDTFKFDVGICNAGKECSADYSPPTAKKGDDCADSASGITMLGLPLLICIILGVNRIM